MSMETNDYLGVVKCIDMYSYHEGYDSEIGLYFYRGTKEQVEDVIQRYLNKNSKNYQYEVVRSPRSVERFRFESKEEALRYNLEDFYDYSSNEEEHMVDYYNFITCPPKEELQELIIE